MIVDKIINKIVNMYFAFIQLRIRILYYEFYLGLCLSVWFLLWFFKNKISYNQQSRNIVIYTYKYIYIHKNTKFNIIMSKLNINDLLTSLPKTENTQ